MDYTPIISAVAWPLLFFAMLSALVALLRPEFVGAIGEAAVSRKLRRYCAGVADDMTFRMGETGSRRSTTSHSPRRGCSSSGRRITIG